jgi:hypothetical protein
MSLRTTLPVSMTTENFNTTLLEIMKYSEFRFTELTRIAGLLAVGIYKEVYGTYIPDI